MIAGRLSQFIEGDLLRRHPRVPLEAAQMATTTIDLRRHPGPQRARLPFPAGGPGALRVRPVVRRSRLRQRRPDGRAALESARAVGGVAPGRAPEDRSARRTALGSEDETLTVPHRYWLQDAEPGAPVRPALQRWPDRRLGVRMHVVELHTLGRRSVSRARPCSPRPSSRATGRPGGVQGGDDRDPDWLGTWSPTRTSS